MEIDKLKERVKEMNFGLSISKEAVEYLAEQGYDETYGARRNSWLRQWKWEHSKKEFWGLK